MLFDKIIQVSASLNIENLCENGENANQNTFLPFRQFLFVEKTLARALNSVPISFLQLMTSNHPRIP